MLRCTLSGMIPMMRSKKYSPFIEEFYQEQKDYFDKIIKNKSYYLLRELPIHIASRILEPEVDVILSRQKKDGMWHKGNPEKTTYDVLSAFNHINILGDLIADKKLKNVLESITDKYDYDSLLIKSIIYGQTDENDIDAINKLIIEIKNAQSENGSWEDTVVATVHHLEKLINLGLSKNDNFVQKGINFIFDNCNLEWEAHQGSGKAYGLQSNYVFSTENRDSEFDAALKYKSEMVPRLICYRHLGIMQNSLCMKLFIQLGLEEDKRVELALDEIYSIYRKYNSLCYYKIQKKFISHKR